MEGLNKSPQEECQGEGKTRGTGWATPPGLTSLSWNSLSFVQPPLCTSPSSIDFGIQLDEENLNVSFVMVPTFPSKQLSCTDISGGFTAERYMKVPMVNWIVYYKDGSEARVKDG